MVFRAGHSPSEIEVDGPLRPTMCELIRRLSKPLKNAATTLALGVLGGRSMALEAESGRIAAESRMGA